MKKDFSESSESGSDQSEELLEEKDECHSELVEFITRDTKNRQRESSLRKLENWTQQR